MSDSLGASNLYHSLRFSSNLPRRQENPASSTPYKSYGCPNGYSVQISVFSSPFQCQTSPDGVGMKKKAEEITIRGPP
ncbi:hypothetical protein ACLB2K_029629 [Fragaria x ananassa]